MYRIEPRSEKEKGGHCLPPSPLWKGLVLVLGRRRVLPATCMLRRGLRRLRVTRAVRTAGRLAARSSTGSSLGVLSHLRRRLLRGKNARYVSPTMFIIARIYATPFRPFTSFYYFSSSLVVHPNVVSSFAFSPSLLFFLTDQLLYVQYLFLVVYSTDYTLLPSSFSLSL